MGITDGQSFKDSYLRGSSPGRQMLARSANFLEERTLLLSAWPIPLRRKKQFLISDRKLLLFNRNNRMNKNEIHIQFLPFHRKFIEMEILTVTNLGQPRQSPLPSTHKRLLTYEGSRVPTPSPILSFQKSMRPLPPFPLISPMPPTRFI